MKEAPGTTGNHGSRYSIFPGSSPTVTEILGDFIGKPGRDQSSNGGPTESSILYCSLQNVLVDFSGRSEPVIHWTA